MTFVEIKNMIESIGLPCTYYQFPEDKPPTRLLSATFTRLQMTSLRMASITKKSKNL